MQATFFSTEHAQVFQTPCDAFVKRQSKESNFLIKGAVKRKDKRDHKVFFSRVAIGLLENRISTWQLSAELRVELPALKWFQIVPEKHRKRDVTTVFAYSHVNTPIDQ